MIVRRYIRLDGNSNYYCNFRERLLTRMWSLLRKAVIHRDYLMSRPTVAEEAFVRALAERAEEIAPRDCDVITDGKTITLQSVSRRSLRCVFILPVFALRAPLPTAERLELVARRFSHTLQEFFTKCQGEAWPAPGVLNHVNITGRLMTLWWGGDSEADAIKRLRPIDLGKLGL
jgi:hypothetical protein